MPAIRNRVYVGVVGAPGVGAIALGAAVDATWRSFADAGVENGEVNTVIIQDGAAVEQSRLTYTAAGATGARQLIWSSTGALLNLTANAKVSIVGSEEDANTPEVGAIADYITTVPTAPKKGFKLWSARRAGRSYPAVTDPFGLTRRIGANFASNNLRFVTGIMNASGLHKVGIEVSTGGTQTTRWGAIGSLMQMQPRTGYMTSATAGANAEVRGNTFYISRTWSSKMTLRIGNPGFLAAGTFFFGFASSTGVTGISAQEPSSVTTGTTGLSDAVGIAKDSAESAPNLITRTGSGAVTKLALPNTGAVIMGANSMLQIELFTPPVPATNNWIGVRVTAWTAAGVESVDEFTLVSGVVPIPAVATHLNFKCAVGNFTTAAQNQFDFIHAVLELD